MLPRRSRSDKAGTSRIPAERKKTPRPAAETSMVIEMNDIVETKIPHGTKEETAVAIKAIEDGRITFVGAYHDKRKNAFLAHLRE